MAIPLDSGTCLSRYRAISFLKQNTFWAGYKSCPHRGRDTTVLRSSMPDKFDTYHPRRNRYMNARIASRLLGPLKAKICSSSHDDVAAAAEAELSAFYQAVRVHYGTTNAAAATEHWLRAFGSASIDRNHLEASFRKVTVAATAMLAAEITEKSQRSSRPFVGSPCHATSTSGCL